MIVFFVCCLVKNSTFNGFSASATLIVDMLFVLIIYPSYLLNLCLNAFAISGVTLYPNVDLGASVFDSATIATFSISTLVSLKSLVCQKLATWYSVFNVWYLACATI